MLSSRVSSIKKKTSHDIPYRAAHYRHVLSIMVDIIFYRQNMAAVSMSNFSGASSSLRFCVWVLFTGPFLLRTFPRSSMRLCSTMLHTQPIVVVFFCLVHMFFFVVPAPIVCIVKIHMHTMHEIKIHTPKGHHSRSINRYKFNRIASLFVSY